MNYRQFNISNIGQMLTASLAHGGYEDKWTEATSRSALHALAQYGFIKKTFLYYGLNPFTQKKDERNPRYTFKLTDAGKELLKSMKRGEHWWTFTPQSTEIWGNREFIVTPEIGIKGDWWGDIFYQVNIKFAVLPDEQYEGYIWTLVAKDKSSQDEYSIARGQCDETRKDAITIPLTPLREEKAIEISRAERMKAREEAHNAYIESVKLWKK